MDKEYLIELTKEIYKITLLFPKKEPLRYKMREVADGILEDSAALDILKSRDTERYPGQIESMKEDIIFSLRRGLEIINNYFEVAKWQRWLDYFDILSIQEKYVKIRELLIKEETAIENSMNLNFGFNFPKPSEVFIPLNKIKEEKSASIIAAKKEKKNDARKEKILNVLEKIGTIQTGEINKIFPEVSKRTLRRDLRKLTEAGALKRIGDKNSTSYQIVDRTAD